MNSSTQPNISIMAQSADMIKRLCPTRKQIEGIKHKLNDYSVFLGRFFADFWRAKENKEKRLLCVAGIHDMRDYLASDENCVITKPLANNIDIIRLAGELEIEFAFPTQTLYLRNEENWQQGTNKISAMRPEGWMEDAEGEGREVVENFTSADDWRKHLPPPYTFTGARDGGNGPSGEGGEGGEG